MRWVRICGGSGERNRKGRLPRASYGVPGIRGEAGARISQPWLKTVAEISRLRSRGITYRHLRKVPLPCLTESRLAKNRCALEQQFSQVTALVHPACYPGFREVRRSALLPFSARATFHPDCTVGTGFSPVRPLLRAGFSSGVLASCADAKIRTISACLRERFAGCDRRFGISPTPEHDVDTDYATAHAGGLICFLWDNFRDKMTFYDCTLGASSSPSQQVPTAATRGTVLEPDSSIFGNDLSRFHNGGEHQTDQRVMRTF